MITNIFELIVEMLNSKTLVGISEYLIKDVDRDDMDNMFYHLLIILASLYRFGYRIVLTESKINLSDRGIEQ